MIVAAGAVLRCYQISTRSLWFDESLTYWTSQLPTAALLDRLSRGVHPPAHYLILKLWTHLFGTSLLALRSLSVLFGSITIVGVYLFTVEALRDAKDSESSSAPSAEAKTTGLWAAALVALSVFHIRWSWDVRMYSLGAALAAFSSWVLLRALHSPTRRWDLWLLYALLALLFAYTHNIALFSIAAQALFVAGYLLVQARWKILGVIRLPKFPCAVLAGTIICLGWLPWASVVLRQRGTIEAGHWVPPVSWKYTGANAYHMFVEPDCIEPGAIPW